MFDPRPLPLTVRALVVLSILLVPFLQFRVLAFPQQESTSQNPPKPGDATEKSSQAPAANDNSEVTSHDTPATFKVRVNLVLVRVVVRDSKGKEVSGLKKEDFQLFDNRKPQTISS